MGEPACNYGGRAGHQQAVCHGEKACPHASSATLSPTVTPRSAKKRQESTKIQPPKDNDSTMEPIPIPICSRLNNYDTRSVVDGRSIGCGRTLRAVARIPQITSLDPRRLREPRGIAAGVTRRQARVGRRVYQKIEKNRGRDGMSLLESIVDSRNHPLPVVEDIAADNNWPFERSRADEATIVSKA